MWWRQWFCKLQSRLGAATGRGFFTWHIRIRVPVGGPVSSEIDANPQLTPVYRILSVYTEKFIFSKHRNLYTFQTQNQSQNFFPNVYFENDVFTTKMMDPMRRYRCGSFLPHHFQLIVHWLRSVGIQKILTFAYIYLLCKELLHHHKLPHRLTKNLCKDHITHREEKKTFH